MRFREADAPGVRDVLLHGGGLWEGRRDLLAAVPRRRREAVEQADDVVDSRPIMVVVPGGLGGNAGEDGAVERLAIPVAVTEGPQDPFVPAFEAMACRFVDVDVAPWPDLRRGGSRPRRQRFGDCRHSPDVSDSSFLTASVFGKAARTSAVQLRRGRSRRMARSAMLLTVHRSWSGSPSTAAATSARRLQ